MIFLTRFMGYFLQHASFAAGNGYYDRHRSVRLLVFDGWRMIRSRHPG